MPNVGRFVGGTPYVLTDADIQINAIQPPSEVQTITTSSGPRSVVRNGAQANIGSPPLTEANPGIFRSPNGLDEGTVFTSLPLPYSSSDNIDPGNTLEPIVVSEGSSTVIWKSTAAPWDSRVNLLRQRSPVFFIPTQPSAGSYPPATNAVSLVPRLTEADVDFDSVPNETVSFAYPNAYNTLQQWRWHHNNQDGSRPSSDRLTAALQEPSFRRDAAANAVTCMLVMCLDIDPTIKKALIDWTIIHAEDICGSLIHGIRFNRPQTDGATLNGYKPIVCVAAWLTNDPVFLHWAGRTDWANEDMYCRPVGDWHMTNFADGVSGTIEGFLPEDVGTPWWFPGELAPIAFTRESPIRRLPGLVTAQGWRRGYQTMFFRHMVGFHALCGLLPGLREIWNNVHVFNWIDRMCRTTSYDGYGTYEAGLVTGGTNNATAFHRDMFLEFAPAQVWSW
jgi:hypothetical protein